MLGTAHQLCEETKEVAPVSRSVVPRAAIISIYSGALAIVASAFLRDYGFPLDDSYIHQTIARNFTRTKVLGLLANKPSSGSTSVLWSIFQSANYSFLHLDPIAFNLCISWVLLMAIGLVLFRLAVRDGLPRSASLLFAVAPAFCGNFVWLAMIGMEHLFLVLLVLLAIYAWFEQERSSSLVLAGIYSGLAAVTRPEAVVLAPVLAVAGLWTKRRIAAIRTLLLAWLPFVVLSISINLYIGRSVLPTTMKGRSWLYFAMVGGAHSLRAIIDFPLKWMFIRQEQFCIEPYHPALTICCLLTSSVLGLAGLAWLISRGRERIRVLFVLAAVFFCVYWIAFPTDGHAGRYQPLNLLLLFPCIFMGLWSVLAQFWASKQRLVNSLTVLVLAVGGLASLFSWRTITADGIEQINETHGAAAAWLNQNLPATARVAAFDVGRVSYDWDHGIVDLGGLADPGYIPYLKSGRVPDYSRHNGVQYVVLAVGDMPAYLGFQSASLTKVAEFCSPYDVWRIGYFYTEHSAECQVIYRFH